MTEAPARNKFDVAMHGGKLVTRLFALVAFAVSCGPSLPVPTEQPRAVREPKALPSWCAAVEATLDQGAQSARGKQSSSGFPGFQCLAVPNFLVTGFYGPERNPERSDFVNGCFAGDARAATRLRMSVRPIGDLGFRHESEQKVSAGGKLDLGFLGPWAPEVVLEAASDQRVSVAVKLSDAEVRVLSSVAEILTQNYADPGGAEAPAALEACIQALCDAGGSDGPLVYTAKVLAAVPMIELRASQGAKLGGKLALARGAASFEVSQSEQAGSAFSLRATHKLNIAALLEPALPAFERAAACDKLRANKARRELRASLHELGLRTLAGRSLADVPQSCDRLRSLLDSADGSFSDNEQASILGSVEAIEGSAKQLARVKPSADLCAARQLLEGVLTGPSDDNRVHDVITDVAQPLHKRLTDLANQHALPCAEPVWYRDADKDGYGDKKSSLRASRSPPGYVANSLDCYDGNADARPGQSRFFAQHRGDGSFDYDCDGAASEREQIVSGGCQEITLLGIPTHCWADVGWQGSVPACGKQGRWLSDCEVKTLSCSVEKEERHVQHCR